jgi:hypothetical protein
LSHEIAMHDKILSMVRATLLHENIFERIEVNLAVGEVRLILSQPDEESSWPDHELILTFQGVREFSLNGQGGGKSQVEMLLGMECQVSEGMYRAEFSVGVPGHPNWLLRMKFKDLNYRRS